MMLDRLMNIDRRIVFLFIFFGVAAAMIWPIQIPIKPTRDVKAIYDDIEAIAQREDPVILLSFDYGPGSEPELQPVAINVMRHAFINNIKVVGMALWPDAVGLARAAFDSVSRQYGKVETVDWAFMPYKPGGASLILNMGENFHTAFTTDYLGNDTREIPVTREIRKLSDFDYVLTMAAGKTIDGIWITYAVDRYNVKLGGAVTAVMSPDMFPYLQSGQLKGLASGLAGAAEYETLVDAPGRATRGMVPQSIAHIIIIIFIIIGNVVYFMQRRGSRQSTLSALRGGDR